MKNKILKKISGEEALEILIRLSEKDSKIAKLIKKEAEQILENINLEEICEDVFLALDGIDVKELWDRSGHSRYGYSSPEDMAVEMMEEELDPYNTEVIKYLELGMAKEAKLYCMGVLKGIYQYVQESKSEFKDWAKDVPEECFGYLLKEWKKRTKNRNDLNEMNIFLKKECSNWVEWAQNI
ncbi:MAG: hypothetical protein FJ242_10465 [Nitrospira sp.]|nr:hypothetical protein [Nitrospira sp.]